MKNIQAQYQDLLEGKMSKSNFMRNVRMQFPQYVSSVTSYDDSVKILKGKRILSEVKVDEGHYGWDDNQKESFKDKIYSQIERIYPEISKEDFDAVQDYLDGKQSHKLEKEYENSEEAAKDLLKRFAKEYKPKGLNEAKKPEGVYGHNPNAETDEYRRIDHLNYYQVYRGLQFELAKMPEITDEAYIKARKKVVDRILKDPDAYKDLQLANFKAVKEMDEDLEMKEVKKNNLNDKANEMKVVKKDEKGNTQDTLGKKEKKKAKNGKGLEHMTQTPKGKLEAFATPGKEKVMSLKEHILDEMTNINPTHEYIGKGARVKKKDNSKAGEVTEFDGDTATVKWDDGSTEHVQMNVLTKKDVPNPQAKPSENPFAKMPNLGDIGQNWMSKQVEEDVVEEDKATKLKELKDKLVKVVKELGYVTKTDTGVVVDSGTDSNKGLKAAKGLERNTKKQLTVTNLDTGLTTQA